MVRKATTVRASAPQRRRALVIFASVIVAAVVYGEDAVPERSESMQTLVVPEAQLDRGEVYHVFCGEDTQLIVTSDVPLQRVVAVSEGVVGYLVSPFDLEGDAAPIVAGAFRLPVASLSTGMREIDDQLSSSPLLDPSTSPEITVLIKAITDAKVTERTESSVQYELTLQAELTVKGVTRELTAPVTVTMIPMTFTTMRARYPGDLMTLRSSFKIKLEDFELTKPLPLTQRVADEVDVDVFLLLNAVPPDKSLDPTISDKQHRAELRFVTLLRDFGDREQAHTVGRALIGDLWDDANALDELVSTMVEIPEIRSKNLKLALEAAERAATLSDHKDAAILDTLARVHYDLGDVAAATGWQRKAVKVLGDGSPGLAAEIRENLKRYESEAKLPADDKDGESPTPKHPA